MAEAHPTLAHLHRDSDAIVAALRATQAVIEFRPDGTILGANDGFLSAMGYTAAEVVGQHHRIFMDPAEAAHDDYRKFWETLRSGGFHQGEYRRKTHSGEDIWIAATYAPVLGPDGAIVKIIKIATDITERRTAMTAIVAALLQIASGNVGARLGAEVRGEHSELRDTFNETAAGLEAVLRSIMGGSRNIGWIADAMTENAGALAAQTDTQARALETTARALSEIAEQIGATDRAAQEVDRDAKQTAEMARKGAEIMADTIGAISGIEQITGEVSKITRVIESFAFQTNLLSINAAVEAARAGEAGKGFAVVASEVRSLAQRSADASKSIADLTRRCEAEVAKGGAMAREAGTSLTEIETAVGSVAQSIDAIAGASARQADGVRAVEAELKTLDANLQAVSSLAGDGAKQSAALSEELRAFDDIVAHFSSRDPATEGRPPIGRPERRRSTPAKRARTAP